MNEVIFCKFIIKKEAYVTDLYQDNCKISMLVSLHFWEDTLLYKNFLYKWYKRKGGLSQNCLEKSIFLYISVLILKIKF